MSNIEETITNMENTLKTKNLNPTLKNSLKRKLKDLEGKSIVNK